MNTNRPVFVSVETSAYSGATLLAFLLGAHPQIATVGEMSGLIPSEDPGEYLCSCGQKIQECEFWRSIEAAMRDRGIEFEVAHFDTKFALNGPTLVQYLRMGSFRNRYLDLMRDAIFHAWPGEVRQLKALVARNVALIESVLEVTGKGVFVDTSKDRLRLKSLRRFSTLDVRAIHLVRDVRGVVASHLRHKKGMTAREAARQWARLNHRLQVTLQFLPQEKRMLVRYEDLCQDVQSTLKRLYRFLGVDPGVQVMDFQAVPHHIVGNAMRLRGASEIRLDERWKRELTAEQLQEVEGVAGVLGHQYGYFVNGDS